MELDAVDEDLVVETICECERAQVAAVGGPADSSEPSLSIASEEQPGISPHVGGANARH